MEPISIALICVAVFGVVGVLAAFIRQLLLSRDKKLNDAAQQKALQQETLVLETIRQEMRSYQRFDAHYKLLDRNKESIESIDKQIDLLMQKKLDLIQRYAEITHRESSAIISGELGVERKEICAQLKSEIDSDLAAYHAELVLFQERRALLWDTDKKLLARVVDEEKSRNENLDALYENHSGVLEKVYLRHIEDSEKVTIKTLEASTNTFKSALTSSGLFVVNLFKSSSNIDPKQAPREIESRKNVLRYQAELDDSESTTKTLPASRAHRLFHPRRNTKHASLGSDLGVSAETSAEDRP